MNKAMIFFLGMVVGVLVSLPFNIKVERYEVVEYNGELYPTNGGVIIPQSGGGSNFVPYCDESQVI